MRPTISALPPAAYGTISRTGSGSALGGITIWMRANGDSFYYAHLDSIADGISGGVSVAAGQVIGYVGNSGTDRAVAGSQDGARLRFEIWEDDDTFFGEGADAQEVRLEAASLFVGP